MFRFDVVSSRLALFAALVLAVACSDSSPPADPATPEAAAPVADASPAPADAWWDRLAALCGDAYAGRMVSTDPVDADFGAQEMVMHVRRCSDERIEVPFHVGEDRSRTWVLTRTENGGVRLQHDHRHEDGSEDAVTLYGGHTVDPGTEVAQDFPADDYSKQLFETNALAASVANVWTMEIVPGERFSYVLRRPERHFQVDFDLSAPVDPPPAPWGHGPLDPATDGSG